MSRVLITGHPWTGKTELARSMGTFRDTDETIPLGWSEGSAEVATWFNAPGPWTICGVAIPRALRKWFGAGYAGKPCDHVIMLVNEPFARLSPGQARMGAELDKVWCHVVGALVHRGVSIEYKRLVFDVSLQGKRVSRV